jgi:dihydroflavonol-4-reductase
VQVFHARARPPSQKIIMASSPELSRRYPRVLVTGATGLVGNNVVRLLVEQGVAVRVLMRHPRDTRPIEGLRVEVVAGDVTDAALVCG